MDNNAPKPRNVKFTAVVTDEVVCQKSFNSATIRQGNFVNVLVHTAKGQCLCEFQGRTGVVPENALHFVQKSYQFADQDERPAPSSRSTHGEQEIAATARAESSITMNFASTNPFRRVVQLSSQDGSNNAPAKETINKNVGQEYQKATGSGFWNIFDEETTESKSSEFHNDHYTGDKPLSDRTDVSDRTSTNTNTNSDNESVRTEDTSTSFESCEVCRLRSPNNAYCNICRATFCEKCWTAQFLHRQDRQNATQNLHERTDVVVAQKVQEVLQPTADMSVQRELHVEDEVTSWFGVVRDIGEPPTFEDYGRYGNLIADTRSLLRSNGKDNIFGDFDPEGPRDRRYPSLISFVGQTGAGKSTLIKLLIDLNKSKIDSYSTPVVGGSGQNLPTSDDVHLYLDPLTSSSETPFLYADCEGLEGGEREPISVQVRREQRLARRDSNQWIPHPTKKSRYSSRRELSWADPNATKSREFAVTHLYPRLLYTFSDVIVFVLKNPRVVESVLEKLIEWAASAIETSSNQPALPHCIIALNASPTDMQQGLWDIEEATADLFESLRRTIFYNRTFIKYAEFWRERERPIELVEQLFLSYYSSVQIIRIPADGRPKLMKEQIEKMYACIKDACTSARTEKAAVRMLLDAQSLQPYLQFAFDHFANTLESPFDFVQASFANSPIPPTFGGNILKLALNIAELKSWETAAAIFNVLSPVVASCIMLHAARGGSMGTAEKLFPRYVEHLDTALDEFALRHWPCEYRKPGTHERCVNVRSGHSAKGHQTQDGKILAVGEYMSSFIVSEFREEFLNGSYRHLVRLLAMLRTACVAGKTEEEAAAEIHKREALHPLCHQGAGGQSSLLVNHSACYGCLFEPPEHSLPCGHVLCTRCIRTFGKSWSETVVEMINCPLENADLFHSWRFILKPSSAGIRVLTLDGGGIRGIVELIVLEKIEKAFAGKLSIQSFLDLIVGTSTGGIVALGLNKGPLRESTEMFERLCKQAFTRRRAGDLPVIGWLVDNHNHSKYRTGPLQDGLIEAFTDHQLFFGGKNPSLTGLTPSLKVAITSTSAAGGSVVFGNYNRLSREPLPYHFQRPEKPSAELKTWEVARATSAAPRFFKPFHHEPTKQVYMDGGIYYNNPIHVADREWKVIWPTQSKSFPDFVLSIGTSYNPSSKRQLKTKSSTTKVGVTSHLSSLLKIASDHIAVSLDSEKTWKDYIGLLPPSERHRFIRVNPVIPEDPPQLDDVASLERLKRQVNASLEGKQKLINNIVDMLIATTFYFRTVDVMFEDNGRKGYFVKGFILCRFPSSSADLQKLGLYLKDRSIQQSSEPAYQTHFRIVEAGKRQVQRIYLGNNDFNQMTDSALFQLPLITIQLSNSLAESEIYFCLPSGEMHLISGFPKKLWQDQMGSIERQLKLPESWSRWSFASTSPTTVLKKPWTPPKDVPESNAFLFEKPLVDSKVYGERLYGQRLDKVYARGTVPKPVSDIKASIPDDLEEVNFITKPSMISAESNTVEPVQIFELPDTSYKGAKVEIPPAQPKSQPLEEDTRQSLVGLLVNSNPSRFTPVLHSIVDINQNKFACFKDPSTLPAERPATNPSAVFELDSDTLLSLRMYPYQTRRQDGSPRTRHGYSLERPLDERTRQQLLGLYLSANPNNWFS